MIELQDYSIDNVGNYIVSQSEQLEKLLLMSIPIEKIKILNEDSNIKKFNYLLDNKITKYEENETSIDLSYNIPKKYLEMDLDEKIQKIIEEESEIGQIRLQNEYLEFKRRNLESFLKTIIYIIDEFKNNNVVYGIGRGSSCASYLLFKLGLHSVDCLKYNIPMHEFFH